MPPRWELGQLLTDPPRSFSTGGVPIRLPGCSAPSARLARFPLRLGYKLQPDFFVGPVDQIVIVGSPGRQQSLLDVIRGVYAPNKVLAASSSDDKVAAKSRFCPGKGQSEAKPRRTSVGLLVLRPVYPLTS
jgi:hypothetical protein